MNEEKYKAYNNLFESIKLKSKKSYFSKQILQYKYNTAFGPSLARKIPTPCKPFETFLKKASTTSPEKCLTMNELKDAFFSLKMNKSTGADEISFNEIKTCFGEL